MVEMHDKYDKIKHKIRRLKKLEIKIRFSNLYRNESHHTSLPKNLVLVWDEFFDLHEESSKKAKYSINGLAMMNKDEFRNVVSEYFYYVYYRFYKENGITDIPLYDPDIIIQMGLPMNADGSEIKKKFRELAKKYHPDAGGDSEKFIELIEQYKKLKDIEESRNSLEIRMKNYNENGYGFQAIYLKNTNEYIREVRVHTRRST
jgi:hypothetical protein